jgi:hypothetical protein
MSERMAEPVSASVRAECRTFTAHVAGIEPDELVVLSYARGLASGAFAKGAGTSALDRVLLSLARRGPFAAGLADAWARCFAPASQLRRRLVLLVAILESTPPAFHAFEPATHGRVVAFVALLAAGLGFIARLILAVPVVAIARLANSSSPDDAAPADTGARTTP